MGRWEVGLFSLLSQDAFNIVTVRPPFVLCQDLVDDRNAGGRRTGLWRMVS